MDCEILWMLRTNKSFTPYLEKTSERKHYIVSIQIFYFSVILEEYSSVFGFALG